MDEDEDNLIGVNKRDQAKTLKMYKVGFWVAMLLLLVVTVIVIVLAVNLSNYVREAQNNDDVEEDSDTDAGFEIDIPLPDFDALDAYCQSAICCVPLEGTTTIQAAKCYSYTDIDTCMTNNDQCDWDCDAHLLGVKKVLATGMKHVYIGKASFDAVFDFNEAVNISDLATDDTISNWTQYQAAAKGVEVDNCGNQFEWIMDDETAQKAFAALGQTSSGGSNASASEPDYVDDAVRRRAIIWGDNDMTAVTSQTAPEKFIGTIYFYNTHTSSNQACTAQKVSRKHILTAGHCCAKAGKWFRNWGWYANLQRWSDSYAPSRINAKNPWTFSQWIDSNNLHYDFCLLTLDGVDEGGMMDMRYDTNIGTNTKFMYSAYPSTKPYTSSYEKWQVSDCRFNEKVNDDRLYTTTCDMGGGGSSGGGLRTPNTRRVYAVWSAQGCCFEGIKTKVNMAARITEAKYNVLRDKACEINGWSDC